MKEVFIDGNYTIKKLEKFISSAYGLEKRKLIFCQYNDGNEEHLTCSFDGNVGLLIFGLIQ